MRLRLKNLVATSSIITADFQLQVYEMILAQFQFLVLSPLFGTHLGFERSKPHWRLVQTIKNVKLFRETIKVDLCKK